jgi:hypothetical protein
MAACWRRKLPPTTRRANNNKKSVAKQRKQDALFEVERAQHMQGDLAGNVTDNNRLWVRPADGDNATLKRVVGPFLLGGAKLKWGDEKTAFGVRVYTKEQAALILAALRSETNWRGLPSAVADEPWEGANAHTNAAVHIVQCKRVVDEKGALLPEPADVILLDGVTYPLREELKEMGFVWTIDFNGVDEQERARATVLRASTPPRPSPSNHPRPSTATPSPCRMLGCPCAQNHWVCNAKDFDLNDAIELFTKWGWTVAVYEGLEE